MSRLFDELREEASDFFEDIWDYLSRQPREKLKFRTTEVAGVAVKVRPAYIFAERVENSLKLIFGASLCISAFATTFLGFISLSQLVNVLINTFIGRTIMFIIGISYLTIALWKLTQLHKN